MDSPPTPEEIENFLADENPQATANLVDSFLADPAFGERFAWPWMDAARYADSNGYQGDNERTMWPWRDWVIEAINKNLPYDDFTIWQLAGDLLPNATDEQILATGFLRNHPINGEGGVIPEENRVNYVMDMAETAGTVWMGLTMNCCRCHDHKYDPLSQKEYYGLFAFFNQTPVNGYGGDPQTPPNLTVITGDDIAAHAKMKEEQNTLLATLNHSLVERPDAQKEWEEDRLQQSAPPWHPLHFATIKSESITLQQKPDFTLLASGKNPARANYTLTAAAPEGPLASIRLDALLHHSMTKGGIARSDSGNFVLTEFKVTAITPDGKRAPLAIASAVATYAQPNMEIAHTFDGKKESGWSIHEGRDVDREYAAVFQLAEAITLPAGSKLEFTLEHQSRFAQHILGHFLLSSSSSIVADPLTISSDSISLLGALRIPSAQRDAATQRFLEETFLLEDPANKPLLERKNKLEESLAKLAKESPKVMVMADQEDYRASPILTTGLYDQPTEVTVDPHIPAVLSPLTSEQEIANRLDLAKWLVHRDNPLTARVTVNRLWQELFGIGLVKTTEDFGLQGELPVQRNLLDWLAVEFIENGWDYKALVRTIVLSDVYQQDSRVTPELYEVDPKNRLLARGPRFRMPSWMIRDYALAVSGLLVEKIGGEPVKPYQPAGLWAEVTFGGKKKTYVQDTGDALYRRSLYTFWRRILAPPMFFDNSNRMVCDVKAHRTNTPLHALYTLNEPIFVEASRHLATRLAHQHGESEEALTPAFHHILGRLPDKTESEILLDSYQEGLLLFNEQPSEAKEFLAVGDSPLDETLPPNELAAFASVILSLFNTDEALTIE